MEILIKIIIIFIITAIIILWINSMYAMIEIKKILKEINESLKEIKANNKS